MENGKIADDQITASSEGEAYRAVNGRLHYVTPQGRPFGWQPKSTSCISEWLQVDLLLDNYTIKGVATQGCRARTSKSVLSVTKYELEYSNDSKMFYTDHRVSLFRFSYKEVPMPIYISLEFHKAEILFFTETSELGASASLGDRKACFLYDPPFLFSQPKQLNLIPRSSRLTGH